MLNQRIIYFFLLFQVIPSGSKPTSVETSFLIKLIRTQTQNNQSTSRMHKPMEMSTGDFKCKYKCTTANDLAPKFPGRIQARFIDQGTNDSFKDSEMEAPAAKVSIFNLLSDDEEVEEEDNNDDEDENIKENGEVGDDDDFNFFGSEEEVNGDKLEGTKDESFLKQYHRQPFRMHHLVFPLLLAYKLKFFTVIPLLLGSLVLLVGTTGVAGFFFALFAAALAIHSKAHDH